MNVRDRDLRQTHGDAFVAEGESVLAVFLSAGSRFRPEALLDRTYSSTLPMTVARCS